MAKREYLTAPLPSSKMPAGIPFILANEAGERFAFYGMSSIRKMSRPRNGSTSSPRRSTSPP